MRRLRATAIFILTAVLVAAAAAPAPSTAAPAPSQPRWAAQRSPTANNLADVSCASASECFAAGAHATIIKTVNGGGRWTPVPTGYGTANPAATFTSIRCPVPGVCSVLAPPNVILRTTNGGATWQKQVIPLTPQLARLGRLACPTRQVCFVTASPSGPTITWFNHSAAIFKTSDGGTTWRRLTIPSRTVCPGERGGGDCPPANPTVGYDLQWISCQNARSCRAGGITFIGSHEGFASAVIRTDDGGTSWTLVHDSFDVSAGTCPTTSICTGVFYQPSSPDYSVALERSTDGGTTWTSKTIAPDLISFPQGRAFIFTAIACSGRDFCELAGPHGNLAMTIDMNLYKQVSPTTQDLAAVACPKMGACYAVGAGGTILARKK